VLTESLVVRSGYDPLRITTDPVVTGRAQRGMLAAALRHARRDDLVDSWIARGDTLRFAPAFPRLEDPDGAAMTVPAPRAWHTHVPPGGTATRLADLVAAPGTPGVAYRILGGLVTPDLSARAVPLTRTEQYLGVARGDAGRNAMPFFTTSLEPGQVFEARWQLRAADPDRLRALAADVLAALAAADGLLSLGSGGSRAHGGGIRVTAALGAADPLTPDRVDAGRRPWRAGEERDLLVLAPALLVDHRGRPAPAALPGAASALLADVLGPDAAEITGAHVHQEVVGAHHRMYRGPMAERWAAAPGSVVRFRARRDIDLTELRAVEARPLGQRAADGHGAAALVPVAEPGAAVPDERAPIACSGDRPDPGRLFPAPGRPAVPDQRVRPVSLADGSPAWVDPAWVAAEAAADPAASPVARLQDTLLARAAAEPVRAHARALARRSLRLPPPALLGRLREVAVAPGLPPRTVLARLAAVVTGDPAAAPHTAFGGAARQAAEGASVPHGDGEVSLVGWLTDAARDPAAWWELAGPDDADLAAALTPVDLSWTAGGGPTAATAAWRVRPDVVARLALHLVTAWLSAATGAAADTPHREAAR
jgi:hypothetical protein